MAVREKGVKYIINHSLSIRNTLAAALFSFFCNLMTGYYNTMYSVRNVHSNKFWYIL